MSVPFLFPWWGALSAVLFGAFYFAARACRSRGRERAAKSLAVGVLACGLSATAKQWTVFALTGRPVFLLLGIVWGAVVLLAFGKSLDG